VRRDWSITPAIDGNRDDRVSQGVRPLSPFTPVFVRETSMAATLPGRNGLETAADRTPFSVRLL